MCTREEKSSNGASFFSPTVPSNISDFDPNFERINGHPNHERWVIAYQRANSSTNLPIQTKEQIMNTYFYLVFDLFLYAPYGIDEVLQYIVPRVQVLPINARRLYAMHQKDRPKADLVVISGHTMALIAFYSLLMPYSIYTYVRHLLSRSTGGNELALEFQLYDKLFLELLKHATGEASNFGFEFHLLCGFINGVSPSSACKKKTLVNYEMQCTYNEIKRIIDTDDIKGCLSYIQSNMLTKASLNWEDSVRYMLSSAMCLLLGKLRYRALINQLHSQPEDNFLPLKRVATDLHISIKYHNRLRYIFRSLEIFLDLKTNSERFLLRRGEDWLLCKTLLINHFRNDNATKKMHFLLMYVDLADHYHLVRPEMDWGAGGAGRRFITESIEALFQKGSPWEHLYSYTDCQLPRSISWRPFSSDELASTLFEELQRASLTTNDASKVTNSPLNAATVKPSSPFTQSPSSSPRHPAMVFKTPINTAEPLYTQPTKPPTPPSPMSQSTTTDISFDESSVNLIGDLESQSDIDLSLYEVRDRSIPHFKYKGRRIRKTQSLVRQCVNQSALSRYASNYYEAGYIITNYYLQRRAFKAWYEARIIANCTRLVDAFSNDVVELGQIYANRWARRRALLDMHLKRFIYRLVFSCWIDCYQQKQGLAESNRQNRFIQKISTW